MVVGAGILAGFLAVKLSPKRTPVPFFAKPINAASGTVYPLIRAQSLVVGNDSLILGFSPSGEPGMWVKGGGGGSLQMGVHETGFPFLLVSDSSVRNFALGRVDGSMASPILVFRHDDEVKLVFGLDMKRAEREPFLAYWARDEKKRMLMGEYCDDASRVCAH